MMQLGVMFSLHSVSLGLIRGVNRQKSDAHLLTRVVICGGLVPWDHPLLLQHLQPGLHEDLPLKGSCPDAPHIFQYTFAFRAFRPPSASPLTRACCATAGTVSKAGAVPQLPLLLWAVVVLGVVLSGFSKLLRRGGPRILPEQSVLMPVLKLWEGGFGCLFLGLGLWEVWRAVGALRGAARTLKPLCNACSHQAGTWHLGCNTD